MYYIAIRNPNTNLFTTRHHAYSVILTTTVHAKNYILSTTKHTPYIAKLSRHTILPKRQADLNYHIVTTYLTP